MNKKIHKYICQKCNTNMINCNIEHDEYTIIAECPKCDCTINSINKEQFKKMFEKVEQLNEVTVIVLNEIRNNEKYKEFFLEKLEEALEDHQ